MWYPIVMRSGGKRLIGFLLSALLMVGTSVTAFAQDEKAEPADKGSVSAQQDGAPVALPEKVEMPASPAAEPDDKPSAPVRAARVIKNVRIDDGQAIITGDGTLDRFKFFPLGNPPRLVVDVEGVRPGFKSQRFPISTGFRQLRVGLSNDKTRLVFDAAGTSLPGHRVEAAGNELIVSWEGKSASPSVAARTSSARAVAPDAPVAPRPQSAAPRVVVEGVNFAIEDGKSVLIITLTGPAQVNEPAAEGTSVRFGIRNAEISRALRRTIDASSFPSAVRRVTPYLVSDNGAQEVRFAVELKGAVPYHLQRQGNRLRFVVENQQFAEPAPPAVEKVKIPVAAPAAAEPVKPSVAPAPAPVGEKAPELAEVPRRTAPKTPTAAQAAAGPAYRGEKISLVFDDANIRNILQLIGEVSRMNIIAGEDVKGTITLRLIDVPWDQALDLILETKGLGMIREGNVVRVLPQEQIRARRQAELSAVKEERQLEPLVTEVIPISYTDLGNIAGPAKELLTDRGKITQDARNKQIIVTDVPSAIVEVRRLAAILDTPERQVMIEARIVEANSSFSRDLGVKWGISHQNDNGGPNDLSRINVGLGGSFLISPPAAGSVIGGAGLGTGITFGRVGIDSTVLDLRISALESSGHGKVISTPRVSTLNGGEATISQGTKIPYQSSGADGLPKTEFVDANLELKVKPVINPDNSIILDIAASNSSIGSTVNTGAGTAPAIDTKDAKTKVLVRDGETTVIGGIFVETENFSEAGVPLLMRIPILGHVFKSSNRSTTRSELLVFITPRIVK